VDLKQSFDSGSFFDISSPFAKDLMVKIPESTNLINCAIVQTGETPRVYFTRPSGEIEAVDVVTGKSLWHTKKATIPLLARDNQLLAQTTRS